MLLLKNFHFIANPSISTSFPTTDTMRERDRDNRSCPAADTVLCGGRTATRWGGVCGGRVKGSGGGDNRQLERCVGGGGVEQGHIYCTRHQM
jgi:hypothetical protein